MTCATCGNAMEPSSRFCGYCGQPRAEAPPRRVTARPPSVTPAAERTAVFERPKPVGVLARAERPQWGRLAVIAVALGVIAVIGTVAFRSFTGESGGAGSPEAAVRDLAEAVSKQDASTALTLLPPGEVQSIRRVFGKATDKASKAGLVRASEPFGGIDLNISGLRLDVQKASDDVAKVTIQAGRLSYAVDEKSADGPVRSWIAESREHAEGEPRWGQGDIDLGPSTEGAPLVVLTVREGGRWFVSPTYTALESWRVVNGLPAADFSLDVSKVATGAQSPEGAFNDAVAAVQVFDVGQFIDLLNPDELGGALRRYRQAIQVGTGDVIADLKADNSFRINESHPVVQNKKGNSAEVAVTSASGVARADGDVVRWSLDGTCLTVIGSDRDHDCLAELATELEVAGLADVAPNLFVSVTSHDGRWYISPVQTALRYVELLVDKLTERQVLAMFDVRQFAKPEGAIAAGASVKGTLPEGEYKVYTVDVGTPGPVLACVNGGDEDTNVSAYLYQPDGRPADELTDGIYVAEQGTNRVVLRSYTPGRPGTYDLTVTPVPFQDVSLPGDTSGTVRDACDAKVLRFNASAGDHVLIQGRLPDNRPVIFNAKGDFADSGRHFNTDESGSYLLVINHPGDFAVHLERVTGNILAQYDSVQGSVASRGTTEYQLYAASGDRLRIAVRGSSGFDSKMDLVSPSGTVVASADDTNGKDPAITYTFSEGIYRVRVSGYQGTAGSFNISVS